jgi:hypothetical protein
MAKETVLYANANRQRALVAKSIMAKYVRIKGDPYDNKSNVVDILTDLRHYCEQFGIDFHAACDSSYQHYLEEKR